MAESFEESKYQIVLASSYRATLEALAIEHGFKWGERGNAKALIEAIAREQISLMPSGGELSSLPWSESRQQIILKLIWMLRDAGNHDVVQELAAILLERPELNSPIRLELERYQSDVLPEWKNKLQNLINAQKPFQLSYADAQGEVSVHNVRYAAIVPRERHQYLDAWVEETDITTDLPELAHNRSFRFDRITNAGVAPIEGEWRTAGLDTVVVEFQLSGRLAHAYEPRSADIDDSWLYSAVPTRMVARRISSTFWFVREILPYGKDCIVVSPSDVRDRIQKELIAAVNNYSQKG